jgi:nitrogen fixation NifU-like protein
MSIYQDIILEHYRNPRNKGHMHHATKSVDADNPVCGDDLHLELKIENGIVTDIAFSGSGCAISQASASLLYEYVKGKPIEEILKIDTDTMLQLLGIELSPVRLKCALLSLEALKKALSQ